MTYCENCIAPTLCIVFRNVGDYMSVDGELRQIIGCNEDNYIYGDILTISDVKEIQRTLDNEARY